MSINIKQELWVHADPPATKNAKKNLQVNPSGKRTFINPELPKKYRKIQTNHLKQILEQSAMLHVRNGLLQGVLGGKYSPLHG